MIAKCKYDCRAEGFTRATRNFLMRKISTTKAKFATIISAILTLGANFIIAHTLIPLKNKINKKPKNSGVSAHESLFIRAKFALELLESPQPPQMRIKISAIKFTNAIPSRIYAMIAWNEIAWDSANACILPPKSRTKN